MSRSIKFGPPWQFRGNWSPCEGRAKPEWAIDELRTARLALRHPGASDLEAV